MYKILCLRRSIDIKTSDTTCCQSDSESRGLIGGVPEVRCNARGMGNNEDATLERISIYRPPLYRQLRFSRQKFFRAMANPNFLFLLYILTISSAYVSREPLLSRQPSLESGLLSRTQPSIESILSSSS